MTLPRIAALVLAAGSSTRFQGAHKLLETVDGEAIVARAVGAALASGADPVLVVLGHRVRDVEAVLPEGVRFVHNAAPDDGLASSLRAGLRALPSDVDGVVVSLGDMPFIRADHFVPLLRAWRPGAIVVPVRDGRRGNPVLWSAAFFEEMLRLDGDRGAKSIMERHPVAVIEVPFTDEAIFIDVDDTEDLERARGRG